MGEDDQAASTTQSSAPPPPAQSGGAPTRPEPGGDMSTAQVVAQISEADRSSDTAQRGDQAGQQVVVREVREQANE